MAVLAQDSGVVNQNINAPEFRHGLLHHRLDAAAVSHLGLNKAGCPAAVENLLAGRLALFGVDVGQHNGRALLGKSLGDGAANAASAAGYNGNLVA